MIVTKTKKYNFWKIQKIIEENLNKEIEISFPAYNIFKLNTYMAHYFKRDINKKEIKIIKKEPKRFLIDVRKCEEIGSNMLIFVMIDTHNSDSITKSSVFSKIYFIDVKKEIIDKLTHLYLKGEAWIG